MGSLFEGSSFWVGLLSFFFAALWPVLASASSSYSTLDCDGVFGEIYGLHEAPQALPENLMLLRSPVWQERVELNHLFQQILSGKLSPNSVSPTPENRILFWYKKSEPPGNGWVGQFGRIIKVWKSPKLPYLTSPQYWVRFLILRDVGQPKNEFQDYPLSVIRFREGFSVSKVLTQEEKDANLRTLREAYRNNTQRGIRFYSISGQGPEEGRVLDVTEGRGDWDPEKRTYQTYYFSLETDFGVAERRSVYDVDPETIQIFSLTPRPFRDDREESLFQKLSMAMKSRDYVSFHFQTGGLRETSGSLFTKSIQGWVSKIEVATDGEYLIKLSTQYPTSFPLSIRLSSILPGSLEINPRLETAVERAKEQERQIRIQEPLKDSVDFPLNEGKGKVKIFVQQDERAVEIPSHFFLQLGLLADPFVPSEPQLPSEWLDFLNRGSKTQIYFSFNESRMRSNQDLTVSLTIIRTQSGHFQFEDPLYNTTLAKVVHGVGASISKGEKATPYYRREEDQLGTIDSSAKALYFLRSHLEYIRNVFFQRAVREEFSSAYQSWERLIPEDVSSQEILELLIKKMGYRYYLDRGFIFDDSVSKETSLTPIENKILKGLDFLLVKDWEYFSPNNGARNIPEGIFPRGTYMRGDTYRMDYSFPLSFLNALSKSSEYLDWISSQGIK